MGTSTSTTLTPVTVTTTTLCPICDLRDGTVATAALQWEQKTADGSVHDRGNDYATGPYTEDEFWDIFDRGAYL